MTCSAALAVLALLPFDVQVGIFVRKLTPASLNQAFSFLTNWGLYLFYCIFAGLMAYSFLRKSGRLKAISWAYLKAQIIFSFAVVRGMKILLGRARPEHGSEFTFFSVDYGHTSFPSGHSADALVSGVFLFYLLKDSRYRIFPLAYAVFMALLRIIVGAHHPSDVIAGMFIGTVGAYVMLSERRRASQRLAGMPSGSQPGE
jgi:undecaprenyl-diphosphatase